VANPDQADVNSAANGEDVNKRESGSKVTKKKPKKEDKWKQKMMFLYEDGANPDDVDKTNDAETEAVADSSRYVLLVILIKHCVHLI